MLETLLHPLAWIDPTTERDWDEAVLRHPEATPFHSASWARVLMKTYGHRPFYAVAGADPLEGALVPLMEPHSWLSGKRAVSLPFSDFCEGLGCIDSSVFPALCELGRSRGWKRLEFRGEGIAPADAMPAAEYLGHELDLRPGIGAVERGYTRAAKAGVRKAKESGVLISITDSMDAMRAYYELHSRTRRRHGTPPQPWEFFEHLQEEIAQHGFGFIVLAKVCGIPVAGAIFLCHGTRAVYKFGAADLSAQLLRPSNLVMSAAISHAVESGMHSLHFGRTAMGNEGLRFFKAAWGAKEERIRYFLYDLPADRWLCKTRHETKVGAAIFRHMPIAVNRVIGTLLYPHLD